MKSESHLRLEATLRAEARKWRPVPSANFEQHLVAALAAARTDTAARQTAPTTTNHRTWLAFAGAGVAGALVLALTWSSGVPPHRTSDAAPVALMTATPAPPSVSAVAREFKDRLGLPQRMTPAQQEVLSTLPLVLPPASLGGVVALPLQALFATSPDGEMTESGRGLI